MFLSTTNIGLAGVPAQFQHADELHQHPDQPQRRRATSSGAATSRSTAPTTATSPATHTLKGGVQFDRIANDVLDSEQSNLIRITWDADSGRCCRGAVRLLPGAQQRREPGPGLQRRGQHRQHQRRPVHPGLVVGQRPPDAEPRSAHRERERPVLHDGGRHRAGRHQVGLRREAGAARSASPTTSPATARRRSTATGASTTTSSSWSCRRARSAARSGWSTTTRSTRRTAQSLDPPAARRPARARCSAVRSTSVTRRTRRVRKRSIRTSSR